MKGQQTIELNQASVTEAIGEYLSRHFVHPVNVLEVSVESNRGGYGGFTMEVKFEQLEAPPPPPPPVCTYVDTFGDRCDLPEGHLSPHTCPSKPAAVVAR